MKAYLIKINNEFQTIGHSSLKAICLANGISYNTASRGKTKFIVDEVTKEIVEIEIIKTKRAKCPK